MEKHTLKIEGFENSINISNSIYNSFKISKFVSKSDLHILIKKEFFSDLYRIPNVYRFTINLTDNKWELTNVKNQNKLFCKSNFNDQSVDYNSNIPTILLILESPHEDEYDYQDEFKPIAPAQGATGKQIEQKFKEIINKNIDILNLTESKYRIVLLNPIPFQTSLHYLHLQALNKKGYKLIRDFIWKTLWNENNSDLKKQFENNIKKLKPSLIINAGFILF